MSQRGLLIRLFGPFSIAWQDGEEIELTSSKLKAMVALLATAPDGKRDRAWLQDMLWSLSGPEHGRASLRQGIARLRKTVGEDVDEVFSSTNDAVRLKPGCYTIIGDPADGALLEGLDIREEGFSAWLRDQRSAHSAGPAQGRSIPARASTHSDAGTSRIDRGARGVSQPEQVAPVVAVIPFAGLDEGGMGAQLGDAVAQDITRSLCRSPFLHVISHLSCRHSSLREAGLAELRDMLDAHYVISGYVRTSGENYRIDVDFVDASSGQLCWTRDYTGTVRHFSAGTDEVVNAVANDVVRTILSSSLAPIAITPLPTLASHTLLMSAIALMNKQALGSFAKSRACLEELIRRAPKHASLHAWLAKWYVLSINQGWSADVRKDAGVAQENAARALEMNPECSFSMAVNGLVHHYAADVDHAFSQYEDALAIEPNNALAWLFKGILHAFTNEGEVAVSCTQRARSLSPLDPQRYYFESLSATAHLANKEFETALGLAEESLARNKRHTSTLRVRTIALQSLGRGEEAQRSARELLHREPTLTVENYLRTHPAAHYPTGRDWAYALVQAGVPAN